MSNLTVSQLNRVHEILAKANKQYNLAVWKTGNKEEVFLLAKKIKIANRLLP